MEPQNRNTYCAVGSWDHHGGLWDARFYGQQPGGFHDKHDLFGGSKNGSTANARRFTE